MKELLTCADVARLVGLTPAAIRAANRVGTIETTMTTAGGMRLFSKENVSAFESRRKKRSRALKGEVAK